MDPTSGAQSEVGAEDADVTRWWWIVCDQPGRVWLIRAESETSAQIQAWAWNGKVMREAQ
jgi:hypothetical protein